MHYLVARGADAGWQVLPLTQAAELADVVTTVTGAQNVLPA